MIDIGRVVFAARGTDVPGYRPLLDTDLSGVAAWLDGRPGWRPLEVVGDFMRERALETIRAFPWTRAATRTPVAPPSPPSGQA